MNYRVSLRRSAQKELDRLIGWEYRAVALAISNLKQEARPRGVIKLADSGLWRVRVGRYRLIYEINDAEHCIIVARVTSRSENTYAGL